MLGDRYRPVTLALAMIMVVVLVFTLSACQNNNHSAQASFMDIDSIPLEKNDNNALRLSRANASELSTFPQKDIIDIFEKGEEYQYPDGVDFIPTYLNDYKLYGEADVSGNRNHLALAEYDLNMNQFRILQSFNGDSLHGSIAIIAADKRYVLYEEIDQKDIRQVIIYLIYLMGNVIKFLNLGIFHQFITHKR